jgi:hypothetical protein
MEPKSIFSIKENFDLVAGFRFPNLLAWTTETIGSNIRGVQEGAGRRISAVGDLNNDGFDDLLISYGDVIVAKPLILISNGDGTFHQENRIVGNAEQRSAREAQIVDVNGDGYKDIVYFPASHGWKEATLGPKWNAFDEVLVLINNSGNGFSVNQSMLSLPDGYFHSGDTGFTNFDHYLDIFPVAEYNSSRQGLPRVSRTQNPDGTFALSGSSSPTVIKDYQINNVAIGDVNNDGFTDYAFTIFSQSTLKLDINNPSIAFAFGNSTWDINTYEWLFLGKSWITSALIAEFEKLSGAKITETFPQLVNFIDLDDDGLDEIFIGYTYSQGTSAFQILKLQNKSFLDVTDKLFPNQFSNKYNNGFPGDLYRIDVNNDGVKDLIYSVKVEEDPYKIGLTESSSIFINENGVYLPVTLASYPANTNYRYYEGIVGGDFNGDGYSDLASVSYDVSSSGIYNFISVFLNKGVLSSSSPQVTAIKPVNFKQELGRQIFDGRGFDVSTLLSPFKFNESDLTKVADNSWKLVNLKTANEVDYLIDIDRIHFTDKSIAFDLNGNAGTTAKILGAVFGKESLSNKSYVGIGLNFLDAGWTYDNLAGLALDAAGAKTNDQIVSLLWSNVIGTKPTAADKQPFIALLENGMTAGALAHLAADTSFNATNINLVGLAQTGIEYMPIS